MSTAAEQSTHSSGSVEEAQSGVTTLADGSQSFSEQPITTETNDASGRISENASNLSDETSTKLPTQPILGAETIEISKATTTAIQTIDSEIHTTQQQLDSEKVF